MKTLILFIAIMMVGGLTAFASNAQEGNDFQTKNESTAVLQEDEYTEIALADLNEKVQASIESLSEAHTVKALAYNAGKKLTKVTLAAKADETESIVILDDEGKIVEE